MKIMHLISGGDVGGAKTHVISLLEELSKENQVELVCFVDGPFAEEAREKGINTRVLKKRSMFHVARNLKTYLKTLSSDGALRKLLSDEFQALVEAARKTRDQFSEETKLLEE